MLHEVVESLLVVVALACLGGAAWVALRGPRPAGWFFAVFLALAGFWLVDAVQRILLPTWLDVALTALMLTALLLFVGHTPRRRGWMPEGRDQKMVLGAGIFAVLYLVYWFGGFHSGAVDGDRIWFHFPVLLVRTLLPCLVAVLFLLDALRARAGPVSEGLVWLALAFSLVVAHLTYRMRLHLVAVETRSDAISGVDIPGWVVQFDAMVSVAYAGGLLAIGLAVILVATGLALRRLPPLPSGVSLGTMVVAAMLGLFAAGSFMGPTGPRAVVPLDRGLGALEDLALATLGAWAVIRYLPRPAVDAAAAHSLEAAGSPPDVVPVDLASDDDAPGEGARFHPRLGLRAPKR